MILFAWIFRLILGGCIFFTAVLNMQGWLVVGEWANNAISVIPGLGLLSQIPFIGGWFQLLVGALGAVIGVCLWAAVQWAQIAPMLYGENNRLQEFRTWAYVLEILVCFAWFSPYEGGYQVFWEDLWAGALDLDLFIWPNIGMACLSIILFELVVAVGIEIAKILHVYHLPGQRISTDGW